MHHFLFSAYCSLPNGVQHLPPKSFYLVGTHLNSVTCEDPAAHYRGPNTLVCLSDGNWNEKSSCHIKSKPILITDMITFEKTISSRCP